jgi:serine/threonine protein kinase
VLYEMATGQPAFPGATSAEISAAILREPPRPPRQIRPEVPGALEHLLLKALEKDRDVRCQTASHLRADLRRLKRDLDSQDTPRASPPPAPSASPGVPPSTPAPASSGAQLATALVRRHRGLALTAALGFAALAAVLCFGVRWYSQPPQQSTSPLIEDLQITPLTSTGTASAPAISPDGSRLAVSRNTVTNDIVLFRGLRR